MPNITIFSPVIKQKKDSYKRGKKIASGDAGPKREKKMNVQICA